MDVEKEIKNIKYTIANHISLRELECAVDVEQYYDQIAIRLSTLIFTDDSFETVKIKYPKGWWNCTKDKFFPKWLKRFHPVEYTIHQVNFRVLYPDFKPIPNYKNVVKISYAVGTETEY